jgi:DNA modification methylase
LGLKKVPFLVRTDLTEAEKKASRLADNRTAESEWFPETLALELKALGEMDFDLGLTGFDLYELESMGIGAGGEPPPEDPGPQIDRAAELQVKWGTERGQIWAVGKHRVMCGDSTSAEDVGRLMGGVKVRLVWTDPPYGVNYGANLDAANPMGYRVRSIQNDDLPPAELEKFIRTSLKNAADHSFDGAAIYVASPAGTLLPTLIKAFERSGFDFHWGLVWVKDQLVLGRGDYHFKHENILYGWKPGAAHFFIDDRTQTSVFEYPRPKSSEEHPTMKPPELVGAMIKNSSKKGELCYDPFLGSGTTLIAAEQLGRVCFGMEIAPEYVAVILERASGIGLEPKLIETVK